jgi:putative ABC transport system ATP-binding protein
MQEHISTRRRDDANAISLRDVRLTLPSRAGPVEILRGVDFDVAEGDSVAVVGPSGSGKSTLLMVIAGLERPSSGRVSVAGEVLNDMGEDALARLRGSHIGIVFQSFHLVPTMTAIENVALPLEFAGRRDADEAARAALDSVGLSHRPDHFPAQLSGGEQQRVAIARALAPEPSIILADEPTGNLDGATGETVMDLLFALKERSGATLLLITHDRTVAARCARAIEMRDGRLVQAAVGAPEAALR